MDKIAEKLAYYIVKEQVISEDEFEVYKYEFQIALELSVCIAICMAIAIWTQLCIEGILFWFIFFNIRSYSGGIHMETYGKCLISSCLVFFSGIIITKYGNFNLDLLFIIDLLFISILWRCRLYQEDNDSRAEAYFKNKLHKRLVIVSLVIVMIRSMEMRSYMEICTYTLFIVVGSLSIGEVKKRLVSRRGIKYITGL